MGIPFLIIKQVQTLIRFPAPPEPSHNVGIQRPSHRGGDGVISLRYGAAPIPSHRIDAV